MIRFLSTLVLLATILVSCNNTAQKPAADAKTDAMGNATEQAPAALKVAPEQLATLKDVVCGMSVKIDAIADTAVVDGKVYPFCASECKKTFLADVNKYKIN